MHLRLSVLLMLLGLALVPSALGESYTFTDSGCFSSIVSPSNCSSSASLGVTNTSLSFTGVSSPSTVSSGTSFSLGSFTLSNPGLLVYLGSFTLDVDFTNPAGTNGSPLVAAVLGNIFINGASVVFSPSPQVFTYPGGSFTLQLLTDPVSVNGWNSTAQLEAKIVSGAVSMPEGSSLAMLGISGLVLAGAFFKKHNPLATNRAC